MAYFAVAEQLLDPAAQIPAEVSELVDQEVGLITQHESVGISPVMNIGQAPDPLENLKVDYTQYIPPRSLHQVGGLKEVFPRHDVVRTTDLPP